MIRSDCHIHSLFSSDSDTPMRDMADAAVEKKLETICFTDHMDLHFPDKYEKDFVFDPKEYFRQIDMLKRKFDGKIEILAGVEAGMKPGIARDYDALLSSYDWDFVISSTHIIDDIDPYYSEYWESYGEKEAIGKYFETVYGNICEYGDYDSLGHLDYIARYAPSKNKGFAYADYADIIDSILKKIIYEGKALEINTNGYRTLSRPNPDPRIIKRYMELGGELFTIGSDAHLTEYAAYGYDRAYALISSLGIRYYAIYKKRKPVFVKL